MLSKIYDLLNYCYEDSIAEQFPAIEFQLFILSTKSLMPYEDKIGCMFDLARYKEELNVFSFYKNGKNEVIDNYLENKKTTNAADELLEYKIIPIAITNTDWYILIEEVMKTVLLFTNNNKSILDSIILSSVVYEYMNNENIETEEIKTNTKERIIEFSLKELSEKNNINEFNKSNIINFEKERISILLNDTYLFDKMISKYRLLQHILNNYKPTKAINKDNEAVMNSFSSYLFKLRKGIISPEKLKISYDKLSDFREYLKHSSFNHPLLGKCIVIKRRDKDIILRNKIGFLKVKI